eukprot:SAG11_NODE_589_length_8326_cov_11.644099_2_plen_214_part_00
MRATKWGRIFVCIACTIICVGMVSVDHHSINEANSYVLSPAPGDAGADGLVGGIARVSTSAGVGSDDSSAYAVGKYDATQSGLITTTPTPNFDPYRRVVVTKVHQESAALRLLLITLICSLSCLNLFPGTARLCQLVERHGCHAVAGIWRKVSPSSVAVVKTGKRPTKIAVERSLPTRREPPLQPGFSFTESEYFLALRCAAEWSKPAGVWLT